MTTFTSDDREEAYKKIVEEAPNQPGYEDAVPIPFAGWVKSSPPHIVDSGASVNANERSLAGEITEGFKALEMLRQLQAENDALRKTVDSLFAGLDSSLALNKAQAERNNEPVIWTACLDCGKRVTGDSIHTCSPQLKELTDEEIEEIYYKDFNHDGEDMLEFARAILRKAQEK